MLTRFVTASAIAAVCAFRPVAAQHPQTVSQADAQQAAVTVSKAWDEAYNKGNTAAIAELFAPTGVYLTPGGTMIKDRQEMEKALAARINVGWTKETIKLIEAHPMGDRVLAFVEYAISGTGANIGKQISGYAAELLVRDGSKWRLELVSANLTPARDVWHDITGMARTTMGCQSEC